MSNVKTRKEWVEARTIIRQQLQEALTAANAMDEAYPSEEQLDEFGIYSDIYPGSIVEEIEQTLARVAEDEDGSSYEEYREEALEALNSELAWELRRLREARETLIRAGLSTLEVDIKINDANAKLEARANEADL